MSLPAAVAVAEEAGIVAVTSLPVGLCGRGLFWSDPEEPPSQENQERTALNLDSDRDQDQDQDQVQELRSGSYRTSASLL